jgi:hypothetical protein
MRAYIRIIGAADGAIMPTIITAHMAKTNANSMALQGAFAGAMHARGSRAQQAGKLEARLLLA